MSTMSEEQFRSALDPKGLLRPGALTPPEREQAYTVFAQRDTVVLDLAALRTHASRFFDAKLGLTTPKHYDDPLPVEDAARVVVATSDERTSGTRLCFGRPADESDYLVADAAERAQQTYGMAVLARRCGSVWLVVHESADDPVALMIAAILASVLLGPILSPAQQKLFGVRTARLELAASARQAPVPTDSKS